MPDFLTHYYRKESQPFLSLSALSEQDAEKIMKELYQDDAIWSRFKNPLRYLHDRKQTEKWVRKAFMAKGGKPKDDFPIYMVLGRCPAFEENVETGDLEKIQIPLSFFTYEEVSYTYVDSMYSLYLSENKTPGYYHPAYHGKVFKFAEINTIIRKKGEPIEGWWGNLPADFFPYIEAQVWDQEKLFEFKRNCC